ncbi:MAG TPA: MBL fold metallo-hydrolase [Lachnospiraceae bacterium]|nr:MBL fold metallo-hydrolase [Lachnospiraceae bacterium]
MKITVLVENTSHHDELDSEHGLSLYIETAKHKLLMDTGASERFAYNAEKMGIDLSEVDTVIISHGHYDHGGGLAEFLKRNHTATIYMNKAAFGEYYHEAHNQYKYIGLNQTLKGHSQIVMLSEDTKIDDELFVFSGVKSHENWPKTNDTLREKTDSGYHQDLFSHEQGLVICENEKTVLLSGCAHSGIINIIERYCELEEDAPEYVISGFHLLRKGELSDAVQKEVQEEAEHLGRQLLKYEISFFTCHCTGELAYDSLKKVMGERIQYISTGDVINI